MPRTVFFSFHYQRDIFRVQQVKNHYVAKGTYTEAGFFDGSLEEKARTQGDLAVKGMIDRGLVGSTVLCVLIGNETYTRRWVWYEIFKAISMGMGVFGIRIHQLRTPQSGSDFSGASPFAKLRYVQMNERLHPQVLHDIGWQSAQHLAPISPTSAPYLRRSSFGFFQSNFIELNNIFSVYDWVSQDGYNNFGTWVEAAAREAGR